jgi:hypothetical protein
VSTLLSAVHPAAPYTHTQPSTAPSASTELGVHRVFSLCSRSTFLEGIVDADGGAGEAHRRSSERARVLCRCYHLMKPAMKVDHWIGTMYAIMNTFSQLQIHGVHIGELGDACEAGE